MKNKRYSVIVYFMKTENGFSIGNQDVKYNGEFTYEVFQDVLEMLKKKFSNPDVVIMQIIHFPDVAETGWVQ